MESVRFCSQFLVEKAAERAFFANEKDYYGFLDYDKIIFFLNEEFERGSTVPIAFGSKIAVDPIVFCHFPGSKSLL